MANRNTIPRMNFSEWVNAKMKALGITPAELARLSLLSKTTTSRICRNSNDKGSTYQATLPVVEAISVGLALTRGEAQDLLYSAFPEMGMWGDFLDNQLDIDDVNIILYDSGLTLWGNPEE